MGGAESIGGVRKTATPAMIDFPAGGGAFFEFRLFSAETPLPRAVRCRCSGIASGIRYEFPWRALGCPRPAYTGFGLVPGHFHFTPIYSRGIDGPHSSPHPPRKVNQKAPLREMRINHAPLGHAMQALLGTANI